MPPSHAKRVHLALLQDEKSRPRGDPDELSVVYQISGTISARVSLFKVCSLACNRVGFLLVVSLEEHEPTATEFARQSR
jgi:hypothetical protein